VKPEDEERDDKMKINLIVAVDSVGGIGKDNKLPWPPIIEDFTYFKNMTQDSIVIMGRKTWESLPVKPLPNRVNFVISNTLPYSKIVCRSLSDALERCYRLQNIQSPLLRSSIPKYDKIFIIGGTKIYEEALTSFYDYLQTIYMTVINGNFQCDTFFPILHQNKFKLAFASNLKNENISKPSYRFLQYDKCSSNGIINGEYHYLYLINNIIINGDIRETRNGFTRSIFSERLQFDLHEYFPMATVRRTPIKWIFEELMWIIRGQTDTKILENKGIPIWKGNSSREFLDSRGLTHIKEGEIGPTYGFLMRNFGGDYPQDSKTPYNEEYEKMFERAGIDQLQVALKKIKETPNDRRIIISLWDPYNIDKCALPPCLRDYHFYVANGRLSCQATLRSSDTPVALHWNICTAALLTHLCATHCDLDVGKLTMIIGDAHIYEEHIKEVETNLLNRIPRTYPILKMIRKREHIEDYVFDDLEIIGYFPDTRPLKLEMKP